MRATRLSVLALATLLSFGASLHQSVARQRELPVLVVVSQNPWLHVVGSDTPMFALYAGGVVIWKTHEGAIASYSTTRLSREDTDSLLRSLALSELPPDPTPIVASSATDARTNVVHVWSGSSHQAWSVYGNVHPNDPDSDRGRVPVSVLHVLDTVRLFSPMACTSWLPEKVELMISPIDDDTPWASIDWPKGWPGLDHATTRRRGKTDYSLYLPAPDLAAFTALIGVPGNRTPGIKLDGRRWDVRVRFPFPSEDLWMRDY